MRRLFALSVNSSNICKTKRKSGNTENPQHRKRRLLTGATWLTKARQTEENKTQGNFQATKEMRTDGLRKHKWQEMKRAGETVNH